MKKHHKKYLYLILSSLGFFVILGYTGSEEPVATHRWIITGGFTLYFMIMTHVSIKNEFKKDDDGS